MKLTEPTTTVTTLENAPTIEVDVSEKKDRVIIQGMYTEVGQSDDKRQGYTIYEHLCVRCGATDESKDEKPTKCAVCQSTRFKSHAVMNKHQTESVINRKTKYVCATCGKQYDQPNKCCIQNSLFTKSDVGKTLRGFLCLGCGSKYAQKVVCCNDKRMVSGQVYLPKENEWLKHD